MFVEIKMKKELWLILIFLFVGCASIDPAILTENEERVCEIYNLEKDDIYSGSREKAKSNARALYCYWAVKELGYAQRELAKKLGMTPPGIGYAVHRGETISKLNHYQLVI